VTLLLKLVKLLTKQFPKLLKVKFGCCLIHEIIFDYRAYRFKATEWGGKFELKAAGRDKTTLALCFSKRGVKWIIFVYLAKPAPALLERLLPRKVIKPVRNSQTAPGRGIEETEETPLMVKDEPINEPNVPLLPSPSSAWSSVVKSELEAYNHRLSPVDPPVNPLLFAALPPVNSVLKPKAEAPLESTALSVRVALSSN